MMNGNRNIPNSSVFTVDTSAGFPQHHNVHYRQEEQRWPQGPGNMAPVLVPWPFPPAQFPVKKRNCCRGLGSAGGTLVVMVFVTVFAALGLGAYQMWKMQKELVDMKQEMHIQNESKAPQKLIGTQAKDITETKHTLAAHVIGKRQDTVAKILTWDQQNGRAFTEGVLYRDGGLQVNETGLYFVYSRVEFFSNQCRMRDSLSHKLYVRRNGHMLTLMSDNKEGFCQTGTDVWTAASNLGSMQRLQQGDWLFVYVSQPALVSNDHQSSYFGLFKLP